MHAARDPELGRRYAELHARTVAGMERALTALPERTAQSLPLAPVELAQVVVAFGAGARLELAVAPEARLAELFARLLARAMDDGASVQEESIARTGAE